MLQIEVKYILVCKNDTKMFNIIFKDGLPIMHVYYKILTSS